MSTATGMTQTVVGVFTDRTDAQSAVNDLHRAGFTDRQIGVAGRNLDASDVTSDSDDPTSDNYAGEGGVAGVTAGAGVGALWGLGILAGVMPILGPAIAGGTLAVLLSSAAAGAAAAGLAGTLIGMGISKEDADYYDSEFQSGRYVVTVKADGRESEAAAILHEHGGYNRASRDSLMRS